MLAPAQVSPMTETVQLVLSVAAGTVTAMAGLLIFFWRVVVYYDKKATAARDAVERRAEERVAAVVETLKAHRETLDHLVAEVHRMKGGQEARDEIARQDAARMGRSLPSGRFRTH